MVPSEAALCPRCGEDLAREVGHRRLAAGAGHRNGGGGLRGIEPGCHQRQRPARLRRRQHRHAVLSTDGCPASGEDRRRALADRVGNEPRAVRLGAGQRGKQPARPCLAAVGRDAGNLHRRRTLAGRLFPGRPACAVSLCLDRVLLSDANRSGPHAGLILCSTWGVKHSTSVLRICPSRAGNTLQFRGVGSPDRRLPPAKPQLRCASPILAWRSGRGDWRQAPLLPA